MKRMKNNIVQENKLLTPIEAYYRSFSRKQFTKSPSDSDVLMDVFSIDTDLKNKNKQYWGRELGTLWELIVIQTFIDHPDYVEKPLWNGQSPCDFFIGDLAIDPKYRIGSGDSGTLKGWANDGDDLKARGFKPIMLILREDNLPAAIRRISTHWDIKIGDDAFNFIERYTGFDLKDFLISIKGDYNIKTE